MVIVGAVTYSTGLSEKIKVWLMEKWFWNVTPQPRRISLASSSIYTQLNTMTQKLVFLEIPIQIPMNSLDNVTLSVFQFVTDHGVHSCGVLRLSTTPSDKMLQHEILLQLIFTKDEFIINALDTLTGNFDHIQLDNLSYLWIETSMKFVFSVKWVY